MDGENKPQDLESVREFVRSVAMSLPPSDFGSTRAINAMADAIIARDKRMRQDGSDADLRTALDDLVEVAEIAMQREGGEGYWAIENARKALAAASAIDTTLRDAIQLAVADASFHLQQYRPHVLDALKSALAATKPGPQ